jgi:type IV pilus assembly protein PilB
VRIVDEHVGHQPSQWLRGKGCNVCHNTGFRGRVGVYELLQITDSIREMIVARATHHELRAAAVAEGMKTMQEQAFELVVDGVTTVEDVLRSVYAPGVSSEDAAPKELPAGKRELPEGTRGLNEGARAVGPVTDDPAGSNGAEVNGSADNGVNGATSHDHNGTTSFTATANGSVAPTTDAPAGAEATR